MNNDTKNAQGPQASGETLETFETPTILGGPGAVIST